MKKKARRTIVAMALVCIMLLSACAAGAAPTGGLAYAEEIDKTEILSVSIAADAEAWQAMLDNAEAEEYIAADVTINGTTVTNVGIRPKGNSSLNSIARDDTTDRYSFKIKFDEYVEGQTWLGLDMLVLNSNYSDASSMKEYLSYDIMNYVGVDTPLYAYADIAVNGESWGFYLAIEEYDSGYLARAQNDEGELYKPESMDMGGGMGDRPEGDPPARDADGERGGGPGGAADGVSLVYTDDSAESYAAIFDNAETKTDEADHQRVVEALRNLNAGTDLETYVDVDAVLRYLAAHTAVVNLDSYSGNMGHNYILYERDGQISMLPWDYNMSFGGMSLGREESDGASSVVNFPIDTPVSGVDMEDRPMIAKLLEVPKYLETYHQYLQEILDGYFADGQFERTVEEISAMISAHIQSDPSAFYTYEEFQAAVTELAELGTLRAESMQGQLDGTIPSTSEGQAAEPEKLVDASVVDMAALGSMGGGMGEWGGGMPNMPDGLDRETLQQAMEILGTSTADTLTDEQRTQLHDLGLDDEQIEQMLAMPMGGGFGGFPGGNAEE